VTPQLPFSPQPYNAFALIPGLHSFWPATLQPLCLGHEPKARVATFCVNASVSLERLFGKDGSEGFTTV